MTHIDYFNEIENAVTVCDTKGIIVYMNVAAQKMLEKYGAKSLIGKSLYDCHNPASNETIKRLIDKKESNTYFTIKNGVKKLIHQTPWFMNGEMAGLIEICTVLPNNIETLDRNNPQTA
jgi:transcriptional regulator with PAS, ATPase and Fis domain